MLDTCRVIRDTVGDDARVASIGANVLELDLCKFLRESIFHTDVLLFRVSLSCENNLFQPTIFIINGGYKEIETYVLITIGFRKRSQLD